MSCLAQTATIFLDIVLPVFVLIGVGVLLERFAKPDIRTLSHLNFYVFVPALVFAKILGSTLGLAAMARIGGAVLLLAAVMLILGWLVCRLVPALRPQRRIVPLACAFYNSGNFGIPLAQLAFGDAGVGVMAVILMVQNLSSFTLGVLVFESHHGWRRLVRGLAETPVILAILLALALRALDAELPRQLGVPLDHLANGLIPVALLTLGVQLSRSGHGRDWQPLALATLLRLVVAPLVALASVRLVGLDGLAAQVVIVAAGFPTAVNVFILASRYDEHPDLASRIVCVTTLVSALSVSLLLALVRGV
jgi:predicted permease